MYSQICSFSTLSHLNTTTSSVFQDGNLGIYSMLSCPSCLVPSQYPIHHQDLNLLSQYILTATTIVWAQTMYCLGYWNTLLIGPNCFPYIHIHLLPFHFPRESECSFKTIYLITYLSLFKYFKWLLWYLW